MSTRAGDHASLFAAYFPGEPWTIVFEPTVEQSASMVRLAAEYAESDAQSETLLQMLGILPSESAFNPTARDAWTKRMPNHEPIRENVSVGLDGSTECRNGHVRADYSYLNNQGKVVCRKCSAASTAAHRMRQREKKAA